MQIRWYAALYRCGFLKEYLDSQKEQTEDTACTSKTEKTNKKESDLK